MSIYGPVFKDSVSTTSQDVDLSSYAKRANVLLKAGGSLNGGLNMSGYKITNLKEIKDPERTDAATVGYVANYATYLNDNKLGRAGGTMTGTLDMLNNRITGVGDPVEETDCVNKQYVDMHAHDVSSLGRYIIMPGENDEKIYFSVRSKRNVNLGNGKLVEIKNNTVESNDRNITTQTDITLLPNVNKVLPIMQLNSQLQIMFKPLSHLSVPWTFLFSVKPGQTPPLNNNRTTLEFFNQADRTITFITTMWTSTSFKYAITRDVMTDDNAIIIDMDITQLNHITFEYVGNKLTVWINGLSRKTHTNTALGKIAGIRIGVKQLGILSLYNRELNKGEIIEHYIENHVKNFTNDEVLI